LSCRWCPSTGAVMAACMAGSTAAGSRWGGCGPPWPACRYPGPLAAVTRAVATCEPITLYVRRLWFLIRASAADWREMVAPQPGAGARPT
jgi:hypothetical protein